MMKKTMLTLGMSMLLGSTLFAGGNMKNVEEVSTPVMPVMATAAQESDWYLGGGIGVGRANTYYYGTDTVSSLSVKAGYEAYKYLDIEARLYVGVKDGSSLKHSYSLGVFLKPKYPVSETTSIYGLLGYGQTKLTYVGPFSLLDDTTTQNDFMYGAGIEYRISKDWELYADITRLIDKSTVTIAGPYAAKVDMLTIGFNYKF
jgi:hypothetical protein